jgi:hypothetical protein
MKPCMYVASPPYVPHVQFISSSVISSPQWCLVRNMGDESAHCVVCCSPCYLPARLKCLPQHDLLELRMRDSNVTHSLT